MATRTPSASIRTPSLPAIARSRQSFYVKFRYRSPAAAFLTRMAAGCLSLLLLFGDVSMAFSASPQTTTHRKRSKKKSKKPAAPCKADCGVNTSAGIASPAAGDSASQSQLASLARGLHTAAPGAYDKLGAFSVKNSGNVWGSRAALALGYEDLNDHEQLRHDPLLSLLAGKRDLDAALAGKSTLNRMELSGQDPA